MTGKWIRIISAILASCGKVFLGNLAYIILTPFLFSFLHVQTIGECTEVRHFEERGYLCPLDKMCTFLVTILEGLDAGDRGRPCLLGCFRVSGRVVVPKHP